MSIDRRSFLQTLALGGAALSLAPMHTRTAAAPVTAGEPQLPDGKQADRFITHNTSPWALETRRASFGFGPITPTASMFVRNNLPMPPPSVLDDADGWSLTVQGTARSGSITLRDLKRLGLTTVASVLQCSGNGRAFFSHQPSGSPWRVGAAACVLWTGVRVADVLAHFGGIVGEPRYLTATGGEPLPTALDRDTVVVERSIPIAKGLADCLLAWECNGAPLPLVHGGPLRLVVPGYFGVNNVKWVKGLAATATQSTAKIQVKGYRMRPIGERASAGNPSLWRMPVKSWLNGPGADGQPVVAGDLMLYGVAFSGERGVERVEVSANGGESWEQATFVGPDLGPNAWRTFVHPVSVGRGRHRFVTRATDRAGEVQPQDRYENERGYAHNGWQDAALQIEAVSQLRSAATAPIAPESSTGPGTAVTQVERGAANRPQDTASNRLGRELFTGRADPACSACHQLGDAGATGRVGPNLDVLRPTEAQVRRAVTNGLGAMPAYGEQLTNEEIEALAAYVADVVRP